MKQTTLAALVSFPQQLETFYDAIPEAYRNWQPSSWDGCPSEFLTATGQICHVRDIEAGYHTRFRRTLSEPSPILASLDTYQLAKDRDYANANAAEAFATFRVARVETVKIISGLDAAQLSRTATFEGYGTVTVQSLIHYLCSHDQQHAAGLQWLLGRIEALPQRIARQ